MNPPAIDWLHGIKCVVCQHQFKTVNKIRPHGSCSGQVAINSRPENPATMMIAKQKSESWTAWCDPWVCDQPDFHTPGGSIFCRVRRFPWTLHLIAPIPPPL
jgi:hypothetical protein